MNREYLKICGLLLGGIFMFIFASEALGETVHAIFKSMQENTASTIGRALTLGYILALYLFIKNRYSPKQ